MYCMNCGAGIPGGMRFCGACGVPATAAATDADATVVDADVTRLATTPRAPLYAPPSPQPPAAISVRADSPPQLPRPLPRGAVDEGEQVIFAVRPTIIFVALGYALAALSAVLLTVLLAAFNLLPATYSVLVALPLLLIPAYHHLRRNSIKYTLTDAKLELDQGFIARRTRNLPLRNIQDVTVAATIAQRLLGFGDVVIDNASELGGSTVLHNIPAPRRHADLLLRELRRWN